MTRPLKKFCVVDFEEGPQVIPCVWLTPDRKFSYWPSWADTLGQVRYDKAIKKCPEPEKGWGKEIVLRVRATGDDFEGIRKKLKDASDCSDSDLNTGADEGKHKRQKSKRGRTLKPKKPYSSSDTEEEEPKKKKSGLEGVTKVKLPSAPSHQDENSDVVSESGDAASCNVASSTTKAPSVIRSPARNNGSSIETIAAREGPSTQDVTPRTPPRPSTPLDVTSPDKGLTPRRSPRKRTPSQAAGSSRMSLPHQVSGIGKSASVVRQFPRTPPRRDVANEGTSPDKGFTPRRSPRKHTQTQAAGSSRMSLPHQVSGIGKSASVVRQFPRTPPRRDEVANEGTSPDNGFTPRRSPRKHTQTQAAGSSHMQQPHQVSAMKKSTSAVRPVAETTKDLAENMTDREFKVFVVASLKTIRTNQAKVFSALAQLSQPNKAPLLDLETDPGEGTSNVLSGLPASSFDDWDKFEKSLANPAHLSDVAHALAQLGGDSIGNVIRTILARVMANEVANLYSWKGGKGKKKLVDSKFKKVLFKAVRAHKKFRTCQDREIVDPTAKWLSQAKGRMGEYRKKKDANANKSSDPLPDHDSDPSDESQDEEDHNTDSSGGDE